MAAPLAGAAGVMAWRLRETRRPVTQRSIILPPLMMATGLSMFALPAFRVPWWWALGALATGALVFAYPLLRSTRLERRDRAVRLQRSRAFLAILIGLALIRILLRDYVDDVVSPQQTAALFYLLALGMILRWRTAMLRQFRALH
jgi:membrane protein CcdC involved in cytochrome C biogenesis